MRYAVACFDRSSYTISACSPLYIQCAPKAAPEYGAMYWNGAGSDAGAFTTTVYSSAPFSSRVATTSATVEDFCPTAT